MAQPLRTTDQNTAEYTEDRYSPQYMRKVIRNAVKDIASYPFKHPVKYVAITTSFRLGRFSHMLRMARATGYAEFKWPGVFGAKNLYRLAEKITRYGGIAAARTSNFIGKVAEGGVGRLMGMTVGEDTIIGKLGEVLFGKVSGETAGKGLIHKLLFSGPTKSFFTGTTIGTTGPVKDPSTLYKLLRGDEELRTKVMDAIAKFRSTGKKTTLIKAFAEIEESGAAGKEFMEAIGGRQAIRRANIETTAKKVTETLSKFHTEQVGKFIAKVAPFATAAAIAFDIYTVSSAMNKAIFGTYEFFRGVTSHIAETMNATEFGGRLYSAYMTQQAATERQRALQAMQNIGVNARMYMGNEAGIMHGLVRR